MRTMRWRRLAGAFVFTLVAAPIVTPLAQHAGAVGSFSFARYAGSDRFDTARLIAVDTFGTADTVLIARGDNFADALAGGYLAGDRGAPILLTQTSTLPSQTVTAIKTLKTKTVFLLGGTAAISSSVQTQLENQDSTNAAGGKLAVTRIAGKDRYETASLIAKQPGTAHVGQFGGKRTAILAVGDKAADALAGGPLAYAGDEGGGFPLLLTPGNTLSTDASSAFDALSIEHVLILGGDAAINSAVEASVTRKGISTRRLFGPNRFATGQAIWDFAVNEMGYAPDHVNLARGDDGGFTDALALGPHAGKETAGVLLTPPCTPAAPETSAALVSRRSTLSDGHIAGGTVAVCDALKNTYEGNAGKGAGPVTINATTVPAGGTVTGGVEEPNTVDDLSVTGCGFQNFDVTIDQFGAFSLTIPASQKPGDCTLTFKVNRSAGADQTATATLTITKPTTTVTSAPDLTAASLNKTARTVTYTFDEDANGRTPDKFQWHVYLLDGRQCTADQTPSATGTTVKAHFADSCDLERVTTASVEHGAVQDAAGNQNPECATSVQDVTQTQGVTNGPDLNSISSIASSNNVLVADFNFDEAVAVINVNNDVTSDPGKFQLIDDAGTPGPAGATARSAFFGVSAKRKANTTSTVHVIFNRNGSTSGIVRGGVESGAVAETLASGAAKNTIDAANAPNKNGNSQAPDLVSASVTATNTVTFLFDEPVSTGSVTANRFEIFDVDGASSETRGETAVRSDNDVHAVIVTFPANPTAEQTSVGTTVQAGVLGEAVRDVDQSKDNLIDAVGLQSPLFPGGRTALPDLVSVTETDDGQGGKTVTYEFDSALPNGYGAPADDFRLYDANAALFTPTGAGLIDDDRTKVSFGVDTPGSFSSTELQAAVLGTVHDSSFDPSSPGARTGPLFPEGCAPVAK